MGYGASGPPEAEHHLGVAHVLRCQVGKALDGEAVVVVRVPQTGERHLPHLRHKAREIREGPVPFVPVWCGEWRPWLVLGG